MHIVRRIPTATQNQHRIQMASLNGEYQEQHITNAPHQNNVLNELFCGRSIMCRCHFDGPNVVAYVYYSNHARIRCVGRGTALPDGFQHQKLPLGHRLPLCCCVVELNLGEWNFGTNVGPGILVCAEHRDGKCA
jgi:hypothetical protein